MFLDFDRFLFVPVCLSRVSPSPSFAGVCHRHLWLTQSIVRGRSTPPSVMLPIQARRLLKPAGRRHGSSSLITTRTAVPRSHESSSLISARSANPRSHGSSSLILARSSVFKSCLALRNSFNLSCRSCPRRLVCLLVVEVKAVAEGPWEDP